MVISGRNDDYLCVCVLKVDNLRYRYSGIKNLVRVTFEVLDTSYNSRNIP